MSNQLKVERPVIRYAQVAGSTVTDFVESIDIQESLNAPVQVTISFQPGVDVNSSGFLRMREALTAYTTAAGNFQRHVFNRGTEVDVVLEVGEKQFTGYIVGVGFDTGVYANGVTVTAISQVAVLDLAAPSLYYDEFESAGQLRGAAIQEIEACSSLSLMFMLQRKFAKPQYTHPAATRFMPADIRAQQANLVRLGEPAWRIWEELVGGIEAGVWDEIMSLSKIYPERVAMYTRLSSSIKGSGPGGLFGTILGLCEELQLLYVPSWTGPGKLVGREDVLNADPLRLDLQASQLRFNIGAQEILPIARVLLRQTRPADRKIMGSTSVFAVFPEQTDVTGLTLELPPPSWAGSLIPPVRIVLKNEEPGVGQGFNFERLEDKVEELEEASKDWRAEAQKILRRWAATIYRWEALREFTGSTENLPFNPEFTVGKSVEIGDGVARGLSTMVHHQLSVRGSEVKASSSVQFSHMQFGDFELPGGDV